MILKGSRHLPPEDAQSALQHHPDLYSQKGEDIFLNIKEGKIQMNSLNIPGYGYSGKLAFNRYIPAENWKFPEDLSEH